MSLLFLLLDSRNVSPAGWECIQTNGHIHNNGSCIFLLFFDETSRRNISTVKWVDGELTIFYERHEKGKKNGLGNNGLLMCFLRVYGILLFLAYPLSQKLVQEKFLLLKRIGRRMNLISCFIFNNMYCLNFHQNIQNFL